VPWKNVTILGLTFTADATKWFGIAPDADENVIPMSAVTVA
jgi:hypothetical protein